MWLFPINTECLQGVSCAPALALYSCQFPPRALLVSGQGPDCGQVWCLTEAAGLSGVTQGPCDPRPCESISPEIPFSSSRPRQAQTPMIVLLSRAQGKIWQASWWQMCMQNLFSGWMETMPLPPSLFPFVCLFCLLFLPDVFLDHFPQFF